MRPASLGVTLDNRLVGLWTVADEPESCKCFLCCLLGLKGDVFGVSGGPQVVGVAHLEDGRVDVNCVLWVAVFALASMFFFGGFADLLEVSLDSRVVYFPYFVVEH